jgi:A/G-specific adenine glycosylase
MNGEIAGRLLHWYASSARSLPWRGNPAAYAVWVSEIMLQQTRVETVIPYFERWMQRFPDIHSLAEASERDVLRLWEGLGYYSRARNLHRAAQILVANNDGKIPSDRAALEKLPGVGRYTAGAIASIAYGQNEPALDGNIRRVLARLFNVDLPARSPAGSRRLWDLARQTLPPGRAGDYNQALMDLGAMVCTPQNPTCLLCPLSEICEAHLLGLQEQRPVLEPKKAIPHVTVTAAVIQRKNRYLLCRRKEDALLGGMWEFPGGKREGDESLSDCLEREIHEELGIRVQVGLELGIFHHAYTHFRVTLHAFHCLLMEGEPQPIDADELRWVVLDEFDDFPMGKIDRLIARQLASMEKKPT